MNEQQLHAAGAPNGYLQILAGPGTGKTTTIVHRTIELINRGIDPRKLVVLSFTRAAARELKQRVASKLGTDCPIIIGTFHSIAYRFLRRFGGSQFKNLAIIDETEKRELVANLVDSSQLKQALRAISHIQTHATDSTHEFYDIYLKYKERLASLDRVDYDELLGLFLTFLRSPHSRIDSWIQGVIIDEFQDTSLVQLDIALELAASCGNLTVVGDPDQGIYGFRNAEPRNFRIMVERAPSTMRMCLEANYRSGQPILDCAHELISASDRLEHGPKLVAQGTDSAIPVSFIVCRGNEAGAVASHINQLLQCGVQPSEIGVLSRRSASYKALETEFLARGISVRTVGGKRLALDKDSRAIIDYIRVALDESDSLAIGRILNYPSRKIGPASAQKVLIDGLPSMIKIRRQPMDNFRAFARVIDSMRGILGQDRGLKNVLEAIEYCKKQLMPEADTTLISDIASHLSHGFEEDNDFDEDRTYAEQFVKVWALYTGHSENKDSSITLSTIHSAKGLEWPIVFVVGASAEIGEKVSDTTDEELRLLYVAMTRAKYYLLVTTPTDELDPKLKSVKSASTRESIGLFDRESLSRCLNRELIKPLNEKPTRLGKAIDLADGFMLASDLPVSKEIKDPFSLRTPKPAKRKVSQSNPSKAKPASGAKPQGILRFFKANTKT